MVTRLADKVIVLDHGEKIAEGTPDEVRRNEEVLRAYLGRGARAADGAEPIVPEPLLEFQDVNTYYGDLHVLKDVNYTIGAGRDRLSARRQRLRQVDHDEDHHGRGAADDAASVRLRRRSRSSACPPPSACAAASRRCWRRGGCSRA